jgi:superfamily II DNA or RNA helicase
VTERDPLSDVDSKIVDNDSGFLPAEHSGTLQEVISSYCAFGAAELEEPVYRMDIGTGFVFFSGFEEVSDSFRALLDADVLAPQDETEWQTRAPIRVVMGQETDRFTKRVLTDLVRGNLSEYDSATAETLGTLLERDLLEIRVVEDARFHAKLYNFYLSEGPNPDDTWNGSANFSKGGLSNNIELSLPVQTTFESRRRIRDWFDGLWEAATADLDVLDVLDDVQDARCVYYSPSTFFAAIVAALDKDYLLEDAPGSSTDRLLGFQDFSYRIVMSRLESYGGYILANSVGTGKTYVAAQVAKTYLRSQRVGPPTEGDVLAVVPNAVIEEWEDTLGDFGIRDEVDVVSMGQFQKAHRSTDEHDGPTFDERDYAETYRLVVVDEAHNYRNDSNRRHNLERVIRSNPDARVLLLSATPINLSPDDLFQLVDLFRNGTRQTLFEKRELHRHYVETRRQFGRLDDYENFDRELLEDIREVERQLSLKLTWRLLATEYEDDLRELGGGDVGYEEPDVEEISYSYPGTYRRYIFDEIVPFLNDLHYESAKLAFVGDEPYDPERNVVFFRKWRLYKQLESSVVAFQDGLENLLERTTVYLRALENYDSLEAGRPGDLVDRLPSASETDLRSTDLDRVERLTEAFEHVEAETREEILARMTEDVERIERMIAHVEEHAGAEATAPRPGDSKSEQFVDLVQEAVENGRPVLVFSEFVSTVEYLGDVLAAETPAIDVGTIHGGTRQSKSSFVESFQAGAFDVAITTELLAEGVNLPRADVVVNYDLPYNPTALVQRTGRALRITNPKQVFVRNFTPAPSIDRELELYDTLDARLENIVQIAGLDFVVWMMDDERIEEMHTQERDEYLDHLQEYKQSIGARGGEAMTDDALPGRDRIDVVLERAIDEHGIDASLIERVPIPESKPIYTVLESDDPGPPGVVGEVGGTRSVWSPFQPALNRARESPAVTDDEWQQVEDMVERQEQSLLRERTVQGNLGRTSDVHRAVREARDRLTDGDMRSVLTEILTGLENDVFRPEEEDAIEGACETILEYPEMVRDVDDQVAQRDGWQQLEALRDRADTTGEGDGVEIRPLAIARYVDEE